MIIVVEQGGVPARVRCMPDAELRTVRLSPLGHQAGLRVAE
jgi:hypothetical protein